MNDSRPHPNDPHIDLIIQEFQALWGSGTPCDKRSFADRFPEIEKVVYRELMWVEYLCFWKFDGRREPVEVHLNRHPQFWQDQELVLKLIDIELQFGGNPDPVRLNERFPSLAEPIAEMLAGYHEAEATPSVHEGPISHDPNATTAKYRGPASTAPVAGNLEPDSILCVEDRYRIVRMLDVSGGQKYVYEAHQVNPGRVVALKTPKHPANGADMLMEGQVIAQLEHQNIPPIMNLARTPEKGVEVILAEKFIPGTSWHEYLRGQRHQLQNVSENERGRIARAQLKENLRYLLDVCDALAYAHADLRIIHRDLKPANVMLNRFNDKLNRFTEVYVVDWGLALHVGDEIKRVPAPDRSQIRSFSGTASYAAPEMWHGVGERFSSATDVFLLGGMLYEILTATPPYIDPHFVVMSYKGRMAKIPSPEERSPQRSFPRELSQIAQKALSADPRDRYGDAAEFAQAIEQYLKHADAEEKCRQAEERLQQIQKDVGAQDLAKKHTSISKFIEVADQFRQAGRSWEETGAASAAAEYLSALDGERRARLALVDVTEQTGDLALAESQLDQVGALPAPFHADLEKHRGRIRAKAAERRRARRMLIGTIAVSLLLLLGLVGTGVGMLGERRLRQEQKERADTADSLRVESERSAHLAHQLADEQKRLKKVQELIAEAQPWITKTAILNDQHFQQGAAVYSAKALKIRDDDDVRMSWQTAVQRALTPTAWSSQRMTAATLAYGQDGSTLLFGDNERGRIRVLDLKSGEQRRVLSVHATNDDSEFFGVVRKIVMDPTDSNRCFSIGQDGAMRCCDFVKGVQITHARPAGDKKPVPMLGLDVKKLANDKIQLVTGDAQGRVIFWEAVSIQASPGIAFQQVRTIQAAKENEPISCVAIHSRENLVAAGTLGQRLLLFDAAGIQELAAGVKNPSPSRVNDVAFSPDGKYLASAGQDGLIRVWNLESRTLVAHLAGHQEATPPQGKGTRNWVWRLAFAPSGRLFSTGDDGVIREWDVAARKEIAGEKEKRHDKIVYGSGFAASIAVRPDGAELASSGMDGRIRLWDPASGRLNAQTEGFRPGNMFSVTAAVHCPKKDLLLTCGGHSLDAHVRLWDTRKLEEVRTYRPVAQPSWGDPNIWPTAAAIDPDGTRFAVGLARGDLFFFKTRDARPAFTVANAHVVPEKAAKTLRGSPFNPTLILMDWSRDGERVATLGRFDHKLKLWNPGTGELVKEWNHVDPDRTPGPTESITGISRQVTMALAFDPDGKHLLTGTSDGILLRWNLDTGKLVQRWVASTGAIMRIAFSKEGNWALTGGEQQVMLWDWKALKAIRSTILPPLVPRATNEMGKGLQAGYQSQLAGIVFGLAFTPDLGHFAVTQHDGNLTLIDTLSGAVLHRSLCSPFLTQADGVFCFFSQDQEIITVDGGGLTRWDLNGPIWDAVDPVVGIQGQRIAVAPDGKQWAMKDFYGVALWDQEAAARPLTDAKKSALNPADFKDWPRGIFKDPDDASKERPDRPSVVAYAPDNRRLIVGNMAGSAVVWDRERKQIQSVFQAPRSYAQSTNIQSTDLEAISAIAIDSESRVAATNTQGTPKKLFAESASRSVVDVWNLEDGKSLVTLDWEGGRIVTLAFRPGHRELAALDTNGLVTVWNWEARTIRFASKGASGGGAVNVGLAYAPDGSHFVQSGLGGDFQVVDAGSGNVLQEWKGHVMVPLGDMPYGAASVFCLAFDRSGRLASGGSDGMVRIWARDSRGRYREADSQSTVRFSSYRAVGPEVQPGDIEPTRPGITVERGGLHFVVFNPDGKFLVTGGLLTKVLILPQGASGGAGTATNTERLVGLRLEGELLIPIERNRLILFPK